MGTETKQATSSSTSEPWAKQAPYIEEGMAQAKKLYNSAGPTYFPGSTVAGFSPEQEQSFAGGMAHAGEAAKFNSDVLSGKYMQDPNQDAVFANIQSKVNPAVMSQFMGAGRTGSTLNADTLGRGLTEAYAPWASDNYQRGLDRMTSAARDYSPYQAMEGVGQQRQQLAQQELQDAINRYNFGQDLASNKLREYMGLVGGSYGSQSTSSVPYQQPSVWSQLGGAGLGLAGLLL